MSWEKLISQRGNYARRNAVVVRGGASLTVTIGCELAAALRWAKQQRVDMLVGQAEHAGRLRIVAAEQGAYSLLQRDRTELGVVVKRVMPRGWPTGKQQPAIARHEMIDGGIEIVMPSWACAPEAASPAPSCAAMPTRPLHAGRDAHPAPARPPGQSVENSAARDDALVHVVSDFYHRGIAPSQATLAAAAKIPPGSIAVVLARLAREARIINDGLGVRPRGKPPLKTMTRSA
jgi:hypothetical protein